MLIDKEVHIGKDRERQTEHEMRQIQKKTYGEYRSTEQYRKRNREAERNKKKKLRKKVSVSKKREENEKEKNIQRERQRQKCSVIFSVENIYIKGYKL